MPRQGLQSEKAEGEDSTTANNVQSILASSARGASLLISLQIGSRAFTFIVNQILVRFLSPELLGVSSQLELFSVTVLTFSRESIRVALNRAASNPTETQPNKGRDGNGTLAAESYATARRAQEAVNLSYLATILGPLIATFFGWLYWRNLDRVVAGMPYIRESFALYALATLLELCVEPCFAVTSQQSLFPVRASAEGTATFFRCMVNCALAVWASRSGLGLGALPFAAGQMSFAVVLNAIYYWNIAPRSWNGGYSLLLRKVRDGNALLLDRFSGPTLTLALNLYAQSGLKHILTQGDSLLIALYTSLTSQGIYALASNYGSLLARMLFQPIEESSRGVFGRLCSSLPPNPPTSPDSKPPAPHPNLLTAHQYLLTVLHLYSLLSTLLLFLAPSILPPLLPFLAGPRFSATSGAPQVLGLYAYYLPLLAFNGLLEAFVAAVATPAQLQIQAKAMVGFSIGFASVGWAVLSWGQGGARGLVGVNAINMLVRIVWSWGFVKKWFEERGVELSVGMFLPKTVVTTLGLGVAGVLYATSEGADVGFRELVKNVSIGGVYGLIMLWLERGFLIECYRLLRPGSKGGDTALEQDEKKEL